MLQLLLARLGDARAAPLTRSAAAAYAGSFLARAAFVPPPLVLSAVQVWEVAPAVVSAAMASVVPYSSLCDSRQRLQHCRTCAVSCLHIHRQLPINRVPCIRKP
jgi:RNA polymerase I specific transcription initiation factor RRN3